MSEEVLGRMFAPLCDETFFCGNQIAAVLASQSVPVRPMFMYAAPRIEPVIEYLPAEPVTGRAPYIPIFVEAFETFIIGDYRIDVRQLERYMDQTRLRRLEAAKGVKVDIFIVPVDAAEGAMIFSGVSASMSSLAINPRLSWNKAAV